MGSKYLPLFAGWMFVLRHLREEYFEGLSTTQCFDFAVLGVVCGWIKCCEVTILYTLVLKMKPVCNNFKKDEVSTDVAISSSLV